jgi:hypothetical protein
MMSMARLHQSVQQSKECFDDEWLASGYLDAFDVIKHANRYMVVII